jgi:hypothetical protein
MMSEDVSQKRFKHTDFIVYGDFDLYFVDADTSMFEDLDKRHYHIYNFGNGKEINIKIEINIDIYENLSAIQKKFSYGDINIIHNKTSLQQLPPIYKSKSRLLNYQDGQRKHINESVKIKDIYNYSSVTNKRNILVKDINTKKPFNSNLQHHHHHHLTFQILIHRRCRFQ